MSSGTGSARSLSLVTASVSASAVRSALGKVGSLSPGRDGPDALSWLAGFLEFARVHLSAEAASVDLPRAEVYEERGRSRQTAGLGGLSERKQRPECLGNERRDVGHARLDGRGVLHGASLIRYIGFGVTPQG